MAAEAADSDCQYSSVRSVNKVTDTNPAEIINGKASRTSGPGPHAEFHQLANGSQRVEVEGMRVTASGQLVETLQYGRDAPPRQLRPDRDCVCSARWLTVAFRDSRYHRTPICSTVLLARIA